LLEALGLSAGAVRLYRAIVENPQLGGAELGDLLGWPVDQVHGALDELVNLALVRRSWEQPDTLLAVSPAVGFASLLAREESELLRRQEKVASTRAEVMQLVKEYSQQYQVRNPDIETLSGLDRVRSRIEELALACTSEIAAFAPGGPQDPEVMEASRPLDLAVLQRNVLMRTVYVQSIYNDQASLGYGQWLVEMGASVRTVPALSFRLIIYDRRHALVPADPQDENAGAVLLTGTGVVNALCEHFEQVWTAAAPLGTDRPSRKLPDLSDQQLAVLQFLADGYTDDAIARRLGVSIRTVRRITAELLAMLGARSRFQAGVRAVERRFLRPELDR
jgi:DNA-binding CsgD family transcriptional regulator/sugar-specific transcriptional regulator TrmB